MRIGLDTDFDQPLRAMGFTPEFNTPAQFSEEIRQETRRWAGSVKAADLPIE